MTVDELRAWLNRPCPPGTWREFIDGEPVESSLALVQWGGPVADQRDWYEFELARAADPQMEAGHA